jgi:hypothetical protein
LRGFWLSDFPRVAAVSRIFFSFSCCSRPELGVRSPSGWCLTRTRASTAGSGLFLFIFFCLRSPAVPSGSSHRECCQAKAFSAHPDLIPSCEQRGTPARNPSLSSWISRHSAAPLVLVSAPLTPCRIFVSSRHFCQDLAASSLGQIPARLCVRRPDFCCRTLCVPG